MSLTAKRKKFVEAYCGPAKLNGTRAAKAAGYAAGSASEEAYRLLRNAQVQAAIAKRLEQHSMSAAEATERMAQLARGSLEPFLDDDGELNLASEEAVENRHLVKKVKHGMTAHGATVELEIHDPKDALKEILKLHGAYAQPEAGEMRVLVVTDVKDVQPYE